MKQTVALLLVQCLENEGVKFIFGIPGEENIYFVDACRNSSIRYILVRHEQGASFMAEIYGRLTGEAGVCSATLGPGAINLTLGVADAYLDGIPVIAIAAQVGLNRIFKTTHQFIDLEALFKPITKWSDTIVNPVNTREMVRKAFKLACQERPGPVFLAVPEDVEKIVMDPPLKPLKLNKVFGGNANQAQIQRALELLRQSKKPIILLGYGATRHAQQLQIIQFAEKLHAPVTATFQAKGSFPDDHPLMLGTVGFMVHDLVNFGFDQADLIIAIGYELEEYSPVHINPQSKIPILHIHSLPAEVDENYLISVGIEGDIGLCLETLTAQLPAEIKKEKPSSKISELIQEELDFGKRSQDFPLKPQKIVTDIRQALGREDIVLVDTGALKMWMARLYPTYMPNTCVLSNGLATMGFALPGALAAKLAFPERKVLAVMGDGSFLMNAQEIETAIREKISFTILVWVDDGYGLIRWKMDLELKRHSQVDFTNPDFIQFAMSFGAKGRLIQKAEELLPALQEALESEGVTVIACPVDYSENNKLTDRLGKLDFTL